MIELAEQVAKTILEYSNKEHQIEGVLLFGSTLTGQRYRPERKTPQDVDMVIIHNGSSLSEFDWDEYCENKNLCDSPVGEGNNRSSPWNIAYALGSKDYPNYDSIFDPENGYERELVYLAVAKQVLRERGAVLEDQFDGIVMRESMHYRNKDRPFVISGIAAIVAYKEAVNRDINHESEEFTIVVTAAKERIERRMIQIDEEMTYKKIGEIIPAELHFNRDFDLHTLDARLLSRELQERDLPTKFNPDEERAELCRKKCTNPTFWHSVLSTGRLFDGEHFTIPAEEKYKGCLELFPH